MTAPLEAPAMPYHLIETPDRISAVDSDGVEICGAHKPAGFAHWSVYITVRVGHPHHVIATTEAAAREHVELIAHLFTNSQGGHL